MGGERACVEVWVLTRLQGANALVELAYAGPAEGAPPEAGEAFTITPGNGDELDRMVWEIESRHPAVRRTYLSRASWESSRD